ncbi:hypothetical protein [Williamsia phyllosphaerae]|uniref:Uncharacterized protein n=1 Tax=Williamsia phyllosphaerae TaxID=885042 RepID=A0ABQ1U8E8_9NOCA|nr:hypothetical protein [Williamsia phyllosphaerae]GGF13037.1 hypothetical protein GCM10007298_06210 [Williamsia phyllosphaerae]
MTEFNGGTVPAGYEVWTVTFGDGICCEELDVLAPVGSSSDTVRTIAGPNIAADYLLGLRIVDVSPFLGMTIWSI